MFPILALRPAALASARFVAPAAGEGVKLAVTALTAYATFATTAAVTGGLGYGIWKGGRAIVRPVRMLRDRIRNGFDEFISEEVNARINELIRNGQLAVPTAAPAAE